MTTKTKQLNTKSSDIEWIGNIPRDWTVKPVLELFEISKSKIKEGEKEALSVGYMGVVPQLENAAKNIAEGDRKHVLPGDIVINSRSDRMGAAGMSSFEGGVSLVYHVLRPKIGLKNRYFHYVYRNVMFSQEFYKHGNGIVADLWSTKDSILKRLRVPIPPDRVQEKIACFLDTKIPKIDHVIEKKQKFIQLLKEKRVSIITKAVTSGVSADVTVKDSGIVWAGKIPEGWKVERLKFVLTLLNKKANADTGNKVSLENIESWSGRFIDTQSECSDLGVEFQSGDVLFGKLRPYLGKVMLTENVGEAIGDILVYRPNLAKVDPTFCFYAFISYRFIDAINSYTYGVKMPRANPLTIGSLPFILPPKGDQRQIVEKIKDETKEVNILLAKIFKQIEKLREYRASVIYSAVTGKIQI